MNTRHLTVAAVAATTVTVGLLVPAPTTAAPGKTKADVSIGDGTVLLLLKADTRLTRAAVVAAHPCLSYTYRAGKVQVCVRDNDWAQVRQTGSFARRPFLIPFQVERESRRRLTVVMRQADVMLPAGAATADAWCTTCRRRSRPAVVHQMRTRACTADGPWLVHSAPRPIGKAVALTFDDGPDAMTRRVLQILAEEHVPATFFQVGTMIVQRPQLLPRIMDRGHVIGNHTWAHPLMHASAAEQITDVQRVVRKRTGFRPCLFRAPYGENPPDVVGLARSLGLVTVHWNVDPGDWRGASADAIVATAVGQSRPGSIAVFHDGGSHRQLLQALPRYIDEMQRRGYRFLTVPELLGLPVRYVKAR